MNSVACPSDAIPALVLSNPGEVRAGLISSLPHVITALGCSPGRVFGAADIDLDRFLEDREQRLDYSQTAHLFSAAIRQTRCAHLGILVGRRFNLDEMGPVGQLMRSAGTAEEALHDLVTHAKLHDRGSSLLLFPWTDQLSLLGYVVHRHDLVDSRPLMDTAVMIGFQILRELLGPGWAPVRAQLAYRRPENSAAYARAFNCPVQFDANVSGLVIINQQLRQKLKTADPHLHQRIQDAIATTTASLTTAELLKHQLHALLLTGESRAEHVAGRLGLHIRTLHRRLDAEGTHLQRLVTESRQSLALQLLANTNLPVSAIAQSLQYQDPNAFSRAFRQWTGCSPQQWRNVQGLN